MSIEQIRNESTKKPYAEITGFGRLFISDTIYFPNRDALTHSGSITFHEGWAPSIEIHNIPRQIAIEISKIDSSSYQNTVILGHGPLSERLGGIPIIGIDNYHTDQFGTTENDGELTIVSTVLSSDQVKTVIEDGSNNAIATDNLKRNNCEYPGKLFRSDWQIPNWSSKHIPINEFVKTDYKYYKKRYSAYDIHYTSGNNALNEFLTIYGNRYSNIFGQRFLACFINPDGSLEQRIWQPIKPEKGPKEHVIKLIDKTIFKMAWWIPEAVKMAIDAQRFSSIAKDEAIIDPSIIDEAKDALQIQSNIVREEKGQEWLEQKTRKKLETAYYRAGLFDKKNGKSKIIHELQKIGWFNTVRIKP